MHTINIFLPKVIFYVLSVHGDDVDDIMIQSLRALRRACAHKKCVSAEAELFLLRDSRRGLSSIPYFTPFSALRASEKW